jgi:hypothetical protein
MPTVRWRGYILFSDLQANLGLRDKITCQVASYWSSHVGKLLRLIAWSLTNNDGPHVIKAIFLQDLKD